MPTQSEGNNNNIYGGKQQIANNVGSQNQIFMGDEFAKTILERDKHPITVAVTGAGVEATLGIPTSSSLIPCIADYLATNEGKAIDAALRKAIGSVRFSFDKFVEKAIGDLAKDLDRELATICRNVSHELQHNTALDDSQRKMGQLVVRLFHKIIEVKANANIDAETEQLISEVLGTAVNDDTIIDFSRLSYTETFKAVIIEILQQSMHDSNNPILRHVYRNILDIEQLLSRYFCGFYEGKDGYIRTYMYIAWMLWAYLVRQEQAIATGEATAAPGQDVYAQMQDKELQLVTFCYTSFAQRTKTNALYFHGSLMEYVDVENKNEMPLGDIRTLDVVDFFEHRLANEVSFSSSGEAHRSLPIPSFLPPLKLRPVISKRYIDVWYRTGEMLKHAKKIILLGINLATADPYFADMLRESDATDIIVIDRDMEAAARSVNRLFQLLPTAYSRHQIDGHEARKYNNRITIIQADLSTLNLASLTSV